MAKNKWLGSAPVVAQVDTYTPAGTIEADDIFILTITGYDGTSLAVSAAAGGTTPTDVVTALKSAWGTAKAISGSLAEPMTASGTATLIITADTAGVAFKITPTTTEAGGGGADDQTFEKAATTKNKGPNDWSSPKNWSEGTIPGDTASEDTWIENSTVDILYGLDQSGAAQTLTSLHFARTYTGLVGHDGATGLIGDYLQVKASEVQIGEHFSQARANGSARIKLNVGTVESDISVLYMAASEDSPKPACRLLMNNAATDIIEIKKGSVGIASETDETSTLNDIRVSFDTSQNTDTELQLGEGVTFNELVCDGGNTITRTTTDLSSETVTVNAGSLVFDGSSALGTLNVAGGSVEPISTGVITALNITAGICDFTTSSEPRTVTTLKLDGPGVLEYDPAIVTLTNDIQPFTGSGKQQYRATKT